MAAVQEVKVTISDLPEVQAALTAAAAAVYERDALLEVLGGERTMPEALADENGEVWWIFGHVSPAAAVLAVVFEQMVNVGVNEAAELVRGVGLPYAEKHTSIDSLLAKVTHQWMCPEDADGERWLLREAGSEGARPITRVAL